jgi:hypothetical protein
MSSTNGDVNMHICKNASYGIQTTGHSVAIPVHNGCQAAAEITFPLQFFTSINVWYSV